MSGTNAVGSDALELFVGPRGSGKTYRAVHRIDGKRASRKRWVYVDPSCTADIDGAVTVSSIKAMLGEMRRGEFRVVYQYRIGEVARASKQKKDADTYDDVIEAFAEWAEIARVKCTIAVDEYAAATQSTGIPDALRDLILRGRHYGASVYGITQRLFDFSPQLRQNFAVAYIHGVTVAFDVRDMNSIGIAADGQKKLGDMVRSLDRHHAVAYTLTNGTYHEVGADPQAE